MSSLPERVRHALIKRGGPLLAGAGCILALGVAASPAAARPWGGAGQWGHGHRAAPLIPGNLLLATSDYAPADIQAGVTQLPPECNIATPPDCATAVAGGTYPFSFNNDSIDAFFGITSPVNLDELTPWGQHIGTIPVPDNDLVTSFSSKSELALNLSPEGNYLSLVGYVAQPGEVDVSNANTPGVIDPGNGDVGPFYRVVAQLDRWGHWTFTETNAYSGDNGRAAITNDENGQDLLYTAGNAGQSSRPPANVVASTGAQFMTPSFAARGRPEPRRTDPARELQHQPVGRPAGQVHEGQQLPRHRDQQQRHLLHQGQWRQRRRHRVLRRHDGQGLPGYRCWAAGAGRSAADVCAGVVGDESRHGEQAQQCSRAHQHVHPQGLPDQSRSGDQYVPVDPEVPVRDVVRQLAYPVRRR